MSPRMPMRTPVTWSAAVCAALLVITAVRADDGARAWPSILVGESAQPGADAPAPASGGGAELNPPGSSPPSAAAFTEQQIKALIEAAIRDYEDRKQAAGDQPDPAATPKPAGQSTAMPANWQNGLQLASPDGAFRLHLGGLIHMDAAWWQAGDPIMFNPGGVGPLNDGANFRRLRFHSYGTMYDTVEWRVEVGFENRLPQLFDVFVELPDLPGIGSLRVGHFREPYGIDALTSYNNLTFLERSLATEPFAPLFQIGAMLHGNWLGENATYAAGIFRTKADLFDSSSFGDGCYAYTSRLTFNPWYDEDDAGVLHLGGAYSYRVLPLLNPFGVLVNSGGVRRVLFTTRPELRVGSPFFLATPVIAADREQLASGEFGFTVGSFFLQSEYMAAFVGDAVLPALPGSLPAHGDLFYHGFSVQASYFLTGESRPYVRKDGIFGQVRPIENFNWPHGEHAGSESFGLGAWEAAVRYSWLDLDSRGINGGRLSDLTLGLNWYLNPQCRVATNYIFTWRDAADPRSDGAARALGVRFQLEY